MKKIILYIVVIAFIVGVTAKFAIEYGEKQAYLKRIEELNNVVATLKTDFFGSTKYTDITAVTKDAKSGEMKFLAAKINREKNTVRHIQTTKLGLSSQATVIVKYAVEYSFGFDLKPENFEISANDAGIEVKVGRPMLVANPAVNPLSYQIPSKGFLVKEEAAVIAIQQKLPALEYKTGEMMVSDDAIKALCEKKLVELLTNIISKQPNVQQMPYIKVTYK